MRPLDRHADWVTVADAVSRILARVEPTGAMIVPLADALGLALARDVTSPIDHPPWNNSAMDGFAVVSTDVRGATEDRPVRLRVIETVPAGGFPTRVVERGAATRIMTGAPVPEGADGVVRVEHVRELGDAIDVLDDADAGRNVRFRGEDIAAGATVLERGATLRAAEIGILASVGCADVEVNRPPRIAILATGDELVGPQAFDEVRAGRRIVDSNSWALAAAVQDTGCVPYRLGIARDDEASLHEHLALAADADVLLVSAGASVGEHDLVKNVLDALGFELEFWRVQMRPGSPFSFGLLPRRNGDPLPVFGLPGNPVSALVTFEVLVRPALRKMLGRRAWYSPTLDVRTRTDIRSKRGLVHFLRVRLERDGADWYARLTGPQGSGILSSMAEADALLVVPLDVDGIAPGERATAVLLRGADPAQDEPGY